MKKLSTITIVLLSLLLFLPQAHAGTLKLDSAGSCILIDSKTGQVLYEYRTDQKHVYPASTTKMMTAILALEKGKPDQMMTASKAAVYEIGEGGMNIGITDGEELRMEDLLNALMLSSANETANIIAENIAPTRKEFVEMMNRKAKELGANDTHFVNTCGIHNPDHYTTAADLAKIARYAMTLPKFREIVEKSSYTLPATNKHDSWPALPVTNYALVKYKSKYFSRINGIKTGYTSEAGHNLVTSAINDDNGMELIAVVLGVKGNMSGAQAKKKSQDYSIDLLEYGFQNFSLQKITDASQLVKNVQVTDAKGNETLDLVTAGELSSVLPNDKSSWNIIKNEHINNDIKAPVKQGDVLGYIEYERNGILLGKVNVIASKGIEQNVKVKIAETAKKTAAHPLLIKIIVSAVTALLLFIALRLTLRGISKAVNARNKKNQ